MPIGLFYTLLDPTPSKIFTALYGTVAVYTASVMIRLLLVLAPAVCVIAAIGTSELLTLLTDSLRNVELPSWLKSSPKEDEENE